MVSDILWYNWGIPHYLNKFAWTSKMREVWVRLSPRSEKWTLLFDVMVTVMISGIACLLIKLTHPEVRGGRRGDIHVICSSAALALALAFALVFGFGIGFGSGIWLWYWLWLWLLILHLLFMRQLWPAFLAWSLHFAWTSASALMSSLRWQRFGGKGRFAETTEQEICIHVANSKVIYLYFKKIPRTSRT